MLRLHVLVVASQSGRIPFYALLPLKITTVALKAKQCSKQDFHSAYEVFSDPDFLPSMSPMATLCC